MFWEKASESRELDFSNFPVKKVVNWSSFLKWMYIKKNKFNFKLDLDKSNTIKDSATVSCVYFKVEYAQ